MKDVALAAASVVLPVLLAVWLTPDFADFMWKFGVALVKAWLPFI